MRGRGFVISATTAEPMADVGVVVAKARRDDSDKTLRFLSTDTAGYRPFDWQPALMGIRWTRYG